MTFLPIVDRELRVRARKRGTYRVRTMAATGSFLIVAVLLLGNLAFGASPRLGGTIFITLAGLSFAFCILEGARSTADSVSREKREGTLGLLFLTDLRGYDVVIGKLVGNSINSFYGLLAVLPALAIPLVLGGVTGGEFWRHVLALINALFLSLTVGLLVSTLSRDERRTWGLTSLLVLVTTAIPPFSLLASPGPVQSLAACSPFTAFLGAFDPVYSANADQYWNSIRTVQAMSWLALATASVLLPRVWQDRPARPSVKARPQAAGARALATRRRAHLLEVNPVLWLAGRGGGAPWVLWVLVLAAGGIGLGSWLIAAGSGKMFGPILLVLFAVNVTLSVWVASDACHLSGIGRDTGALELLLGTPLTTRQIIDGHLLAVRRMFFRPVVILMGVEVFMIIAHHVIALEGDRLELLNLIATGAMLLAVLACLLELQAVATMGLWLGLVTKRPAQAVTKTVVLVVLLPLLLIVCYPIYPVLAVAKNLVIANYAHDQLRRHLRAILTGRFDPSNQAEHLGGRAASRQRGQLPPVIR